MMRRARKVRIYVRNKQRYNPETKVREFLYVDVDDFVGTTIADIKEDVRKQTKSSVRIDELFLNNLPLADDRSVAHYNLQHETILETTSNPFWVACLYIKVAEVKQEQEGQPNNDTIQKWTMKSIPKKYTLIGLLLNAKKEFTKQPPHFPTLDDFVAYLEQLKKKGATMHPEYTQKDMRAFEREYHQDFVGKYSDPLSAFLDHYALRLGYLEPEDIDQAGGQVRPQDMVVINHRNQQNHGRKKQGRMCDDCEISEAELYCTDCPGGIALCQPCSQLLHAGAKRRRHNLQDIRQAPKTQKPYVPRAFLAPFALTVAMYRSLTEGQLSLTEEEIKKKAQPLTDTDLMDKQNGRYVGGFDCMENMLIAKGLVKKEAARVPTYALTESGHILGEKLYTFYVTFYTFLQQHHFPKIMTTFVNQVLGNRKICLIIDEHERDKDRLLAFAADKHIDAQVRFLPAGDYIWILTPPMLDTSQKYLGTDSMNEMVLPFVVERKSWEDFENSLNSARFQRQINNMLGSGVKNCYYLMEGGISSLKSNPSQHHQQHLKAQVGKLITEYGFYVNYTSSWMKSAQWLLWFSQFIIKGCNMGLYKDECIAYADYSSRVARQAGAARPCLTFRNIDKRSHRWSSHLFIDHIFRDSQGERSVLDAVRQDLHVSKREKHLLVIQDLEQYNKKRQSALSKCCEVVCGNIQNAQEVVSDKIGVAIHNMVHYDIASFWQLCIQVIVGVYVVRTENDEDTARVQQKFLSGPQGPPPKLSPSKNNRFTPARRKTPTQNKNIEREDNHFNIPTQVPQNSVDLNEDSHSSLSGHDQFDGTSGKTHPGIRRNNIYSLSTTGSSNNDTSSFDPDQSSEVIKTKHQNKIRSSGGIPLNSIKPFSGEGHCLGSGNDLAFRNVSVQKDTSKQNDNHVIESVHSGLVMNGGFQRGLVGGAIEKGMMNDQTGVKEGAFGIPQDEEAMLQQVISQSKHDENPVKNEDELFRLAVAMSMKDQARSSTGIEAAEIPESEENQMKLALEMSMNESFQAVNHVADEAHLSPTKDEELEMAIERSKQDSRTMMGNLKRNCEFDTKGVKRKLDVGEDVITPELSTSSGLALSEDEQLRIAIELSKQRSVVDAIDVIPDVLEEVFVPKEKNRQARRENVIESLVNVDGEDEQLRIVIEQSKIENYSPRKQLKSDDDDLKIAIERSKIENYSPYKRWKSRDSGCKKISKEKIKSYSPRKRYKSGDMEQVRKSCNQVITKVSADAPVEVILIDSQSQDVDDESECNNNEVLKLYEHSGDKYNDENTKQLQMGVCSQHSCIGDKNKSSSLCHGQNVSQAGITISHNTLTDNDLSDNIVNRTRQQYGIESLYHPSVTPKGDHVISDLQLENVDLATGSCDDGTETLKNTEFTDKLTRKGNVNDCGNNTNCDKQHSSHDESKTSIMDENETDDEGIGDPEVDDDDDFVPPTPDKMSKSFVQITPVVPKVGSCLLNLSGQFLSQVEKGTDQETCYTTNYSKNSIQDNLRNNCCGVKSLESSPDKTLLKNASKKAFSLKENLFYDSDDTNGSGDDDDDGRGDNGDNDNECGCVSGEYDLPNKKENNGKIFTSESNRLAFEKRGKCYSTSLTNLEKDQNYKRETIIHQKYLIDPEDIDNDKYISSQNETKHINSDNGKYCKKEAINHQECHRGSADKPIDKNIFSPSEVKFVKVKIESLDEKSDMAGVKVEMLDQEDNDMNNGCDDELHDIDYQPNSQDLETNSDDDGHSDDEAEVNMRGNLDSLPVIGRPRSVRYKHVKHETQRLINEKRNQNQRDTGECFIPNKKIKTENDSDVTRTIVKNADSTVESDEQLARHMQSELDHEMKFKSTIVNDAQFAKELQDKLNRDSLTPDSKHGYVETNKAKIYEDLDEAYAKQLDLVLNGEETKQNVPNELLEKPGQRTPDPTKMRGMNSELDKQDSGYSVLNMFDGGDEEIAELQRKELEKIERWKKAILDDEKLAQQLQQLEEIQKHQSDEATNTEEETASTSQQKPTNTEDICFKQMIALHKTSREKALFQLNEYRQLQMERFQTSRSQVDRRYHVVPSCSFETPRSQTPNNNEIQIDDEWPDGNNVQNLLASQHDNDWQFNRHHIDRSHIQASGANFTNQSQVPVSRHLVDRSNSPSQSQVPASDHVFDRDIFMSQSQVQASGHATDRGLFTNQSQVQASGHLTDPNQSQVMNSNITCGNCGEKGHNRTYNLCRKFHTAEETARREAKMEKIRAKKEEKKMMETETLNLLTNHQQVLEEMTEQIQSEMKTIQRRLKLKTSELEKQVSNRVKKMENAKKKQRR